MAGYKVPKTFLLTNDLPLTAMGKPDHIEARTLLLAVTGESG